MAGLNRLHGFWLQMNSSYGRPQPPPPGWTTSTTTTNDPGRSTTTVGLELEVNSFKVGKMRIRCVAELYGVFKATAETVLDEERPRLASILGTFSSAGKRARQKSMGEFSQKFSRVVVDFRDVFLKPEKFREKISLEHRSRLTVATETTVTRIQSDAPIELEIDDRIQWRDRGFCGL